MTEIGTVDKVVASDLDDCVSSKIAEAVSNQKSNQENLQAHISHANKKFTDEMQLLEEIINERAIKKVES